MNCKFTWQRKQREHHQRFRVDFFFTTRFRPVFAAGRRLTRVLGFFLACFGVTGMLSAFQALIPTHLTTIGPTAFSVIVAAIPDNHAIRSEKEIGLLSLIRNQRRSRW